MGGGGSTGAGIGAGLNSFSSLATMLLAAKAQQEPARMEMPASPDNPIPTAGSETLGPPTAANAPPRAFSAGGTPLLSGPMTSADIRQHIFANLTDYASKPQAVAAAFKRMQVPADERLINSLAAEAQDFLDIQAAKQRKTLSEQKRHPNRDSVGTSRTIVSDTTDSRGGSMHRMNFRRTF